MDVGIQSNILVKKVKCVVPAASPSHPPDTVYLTPIDKIVPRIVEPVVLAFHTAPSNVSSRLQSSLSSVLAHYREWAGRLEEDSIRLTDDGVVFVEADARHTLEDHMHMDHDKLENLLPLSMSLPPPAELLHVQVTRFTCGGLALGFGRHHYVDDAYGFLVFLMTWAGVSREQSLLSRPLYDRSLLFPRCPPQTPFEHGEYPVFRYAKLVEPVKLCRRTLRLSSKDLMLLRRVCGNSGTVLEMLYAHIWRSSVKALGLANDEKTALLCPVNGRKTLQIPDNFVGNVVFPAKTRSIPCGQLASAPLTTAVALVKESLAKTSSKTFLRSAVSIHGPQLVRSNSGAGYGYKPNLLITGWSELPWYELDFGFGTPSFAGPIGSHMEGVVRVTPSPSDGLLITGTFSQRHLDRFCDIVSAVQ